MQITPQPAGAAAPQPPSPPTTFTTVGADGKAQTLAIPTTSGEVEDLLAQRRELSTQLNSATERRQALSEEVKTAPEGASRTGLEERIRVLDTRIMQLESDISLVGRRLSAAPSALTASGENRPSGGDDFEEGVAAGGFSFAAFILVVYLFRRFRRKRRGPVPSVAKISDSPRLERMEQGIEAMAIEIERISEGQRFVTRLLSESARMPAESRSLAQPLESSGPRNG
jgi:chromosome segregation ATPase